MPAHVRGRRALDFLRTRQTVSLGGCTIPRALQWHLRVPGPPHPRHSRCGQFSFARPKRYVVVYVVGGPFLASTRGHATVDHS